MPARDPSGKVYKGGTYRPPKKSPPKAKAPVVRPDVTLGGDTTPKRTGHAKPPRAKVSPTPYAQLKKGRKLDPKGRQRALTKQKPRKKSERKEFVRRPTGDIDLVSRKESHRIRRRRVEKAVKRFNRDVRKTALREADKARASAIREGDNTPATDTHWGPLNIEAEVEGRGGIAKASKFVGKKLSEQAPGMVRAQGYPLPKQADKLFKRGVRDLADFPAQTIPSAYAIGAGVKEAAEGRPQRIKGIGEGIIEHDPIALTVQGRFKEAKKEVEKHPGLAAMSVYGAGAAVSRVAGAATRAGGAALRHAPTKAGRKAGKTLRRIGTTKRAPRVAPGTGMKEPRRYSKGLGAKAVQVAAERHGIKKARKLRDQARRTRNQSKKVHRRRKAAQADPRVMSGQRVAKRTNEREDLAEIRRREATAKAAYEGHHALPKDPKPSRLKKRAGKARHPVREVPKDHRAAVSLLVTQNIVKPTRASIGAYKKQIDKVHREGKLEPAEARANRVLSGQLDAALKDKKLDLDEIRTHAREYGEVVKPRQAELVKREIISDDMARRSPQVNYAVQRMGAKWNPKTKRLELAGEKLPLKRIERHMRETGTEKGTYVTQAPGQRGARNFFASWHEPKGVSRKVRTGEAVRRGTFEVNREVGREGPARMESLIQAHNSYSEWIGENAYRPKSATRPKDFTTRDAAERFRESNLADSPYDWRVAPTRPAFGRKEQSRALLDQADAFDAGTDVDVTAGIRRALEHGEGGGKYVLVPDVAAKTKMSHAALLGNPPLKVTRKVGRQFSGTVLTTSGFAWPIGNVGEGTLRLAVIRAGPASLALVRQTIEQLRKIDPEAAADLEARVGTGHLGSYEMQRTFTTAKTFEGTAFAPVAKAFGALFRSPGPKQMAQMWGEWTRLIFGGNGAVEHQLRLAALGRHLKNEGFGPNWAKNGAKAMNIAAEQAARGMKGTNEQVMAARFVDRAMGRYGKWSPSSRFAIAVFTPFVAWAVNAVKFFVDVLPRDHPVLTGLIATSEVATEEWRNSYGLGKYIKGAAPGWMQPSIVVNGKLVPIGRYTPAGFFADPLETATGQVLPQFQSIYMAARGLDWKGDPINDHERADDASETERLDEIRKAAMGSFVPFFSLSERVRERGVNAINPARAYKYDRKTSVAFERLEEIEARKKEISDAAKKKGKVVDSDHPTPEYERLHREFRHLNEQIYKRSKGKYGEKYKESYEPSGGGTSGGGDFWNLKGDPKVRPKEPSGGGGGSYWDLP